MAPSITLRYPPRCRIEVPAGQSEGRQSAAKYDEDERQFLHAMGLLSIREKPTLNFCFGSSSFHIDIARTRFCRRRNTLSSSILPCHSISLHPAQARRSRKVVGAVRGNEITAPHLQRTSSAGISFKSKRTICCGVISELGASPMSHQFFT